MSGRLTIILILLLACYSTGQAQFKWEISNNGQDWQYDHYYTVSDNYQNIVVMGGKTHDYLYNRDTWKFFKSLDFGKTWQKIPSDISTLPISQSPLTINTIQLIDQLTIVAVTSDGAILRSTDGGEHWNVQFNDTLLTFSCLHFSDVNTGIAGATLLTGDGTLFVTFDGGLHWKQQQPKGFSGESIVTCHSFGKGAFKFSTYGIGKIYESNDSLKSVTPLPLPLDSTFDSLRYQFSVTGCKYGNDNTIIEYGRDYILGATNQNFICRSADGGKTWDQPYIFPLVQTEPFILPSSENISSMTSIDNDTILVFGTFQLYGGQIIHSYDKGQHWDTDSLNYVLPKGTVGMNNLLYFSDKALIIFGSGGGKGSLVLRSINQTSFVKNTRLSTLEHLNIYPNPSSGHFWVEASIPIESLSVYDALGRLIRTIAVSNTTTSISMRELPQGFYTIKVLYQNNEYSSPTPLIISR